MRVNENNRQIKIDLQIKKRKNTMQSPSKIIVKQRQQSTKSSNNSRKLNITMCNTKRNEQNKQSQLIGNPTRKVIISEFNTNDLQSNLNLLPQHLPMKRDAFPPRVKLQESNITVRNNPKNDSIQWWEYAQAQQMRQKKELIQQIRRKDVQIEFYEKLLHQKVDKAKEDVNKKQLQYEQYLQNLINLYQAQISKSQKLGKTVEQNALSKYLQKKREQINLQGKMGLNFSPKQLSTFSGMSEASILLQSFQKNISKQERQKRAELYSFGSSNKLQRSQSLIKQAQSHNFLNPKKALIASRKKLF